MQRHRICWLDVVAVILVAATYLAGLILIARHGESDSLMLLLVVLMWVIGFAFVLLFSRRHASPRAGFVVGALLSAIPFYAPLLIGDFSHPWLALLLGFVVVVIPSACLVAGVNWAERKFDGGRRRLVRGSCLALLVGGVALVAILGWSLRQDYAPGELAPTLELRRVARLGDPGLSEDVLQQAISMGEPPSGYLWAEADVTFDRDSLGEEAATRRGDGRLYILLADQFPYAMTHDAGSAAWGLKSVERVEERSEHFDATTYGVNLVLDRKGAELIGQVSRACLQRELALVVDGRMFSAPTVQSYFSERLQLSRMLWDHDATEADEAEFRRWADELLALLGSEG